MKSVVQNIQGSQPATDEELGLGYETYYRNEYGSRSPENYRWLLSAILMYGRPGNILDLGCGLGLLVEIASNWGLDASGCDGSEDAVRMALRKNPSLRITQCRLGCRLPFDPGTIDNVVLNQVIEHLPANVLRNLLSECSRILQSGGMVFIHSPNKANRQEVQKDATHLNPLYPSELRQLLVCAGFEVIAEPNVPRFSARIPGEGRLLSALMKTSMRDWLSATTNAYARKR